jgi:hypothetical protein
MGGISPHQSGAVPFTTMSWLRTMMSGLPMAQVLPSSNVRAGGRSAGLPSRAPVSAHLAILAISSSLSDGSFLYFWMPTFRSTYHGGITPALGPRPVRVLMARAHGRTSA